MEDKCEYSRLTLPNDSTYVDVAVAYVDAVARKLGFDRHEREDIERATREAVSNAIEHAYEPWEKESFEISCERVPLGLQIVVKDSGLPFDAGNVPECNLESGPLAEPGPGCGILAMQESMNEVSFRNLGRGGKETVLVKYLKNSDITDYVEACELGPFEAPRTPRPRIKAPVEVTVRAMQPSEAIEVSKCVYKAYGYTYTFENIYFPDRIVELNKSGRMYSAVAVTRDNVVAGHAALLKWSEDAEIAETGMGVVKPEFRSGGIFVRLEEHLIEKAKSDGLIGIFGRAVTTHTFSQRVGLRFGVRDCAIGLGVVPQSARFKGITEKLSQRETLLTHFLYLRRPGRHIIHPPKHHSDMIKGLYEDLGASPEMRLRGDAPEAEIPSQAIVKTGIYGPMGLARIDVETYGNDVVAQVRTTLSDLRLKHVDVIHLYLDLFDPWTGSFVERFEELGFFFSGILPGALPGDALILQYLNNVPIDYSKIKLASQRAGHLLSYIERLDPNRM